MKKVFTSIVILSAAAVAPASPIMTEGFDYTAGSALLGQTNPSTGNNWLQAAANPPTVINVDSNGSAVDIKGIGNSSGGVDRLALPTAINSGTVYYSFQMVVTALTGSNNTTGGFFIGLNNTGNSSQTTNPNVVGAKIQARIDPTDATKYDLGIFTNITATAGAASWSPTALKPGDIETIVAAYTFNTVSGTDDVASIWINPSVSDLQATTAPTPTETSTGGDITSPPAVQVGSVILRQSPAPFLALDNLNVSSSWADVTSTLPVPEPASLGLLGMGAVRLVSARRKKSA